MTEFSRVDYAEKIRKMLDKAESTDSEHEREAFTQRAMELMERYAIDEAMLRDAKQLEREELVTFDFDFRGRFAKWNRRITSAVAARMNCKCVIYDNDDYWSKRAGDVYFRLRVHGFASDVERVKMLDASLQIQSLRAMKSWEREIGLRSMDIPQWDKFKKRREFILGFASGVSSKLATALREAQAAVVNERQESGMDAEEASTGVALVLRDRKDQVNDWYDSLYGNSLRTVRTRYASGGYSARQAGHAAGLSADTGQGNLGGTRKQIR